jgi:hypothetical protein
MKFEDLALSERDVENYRITYSMGELPENNERSATALGMC